MQKVLLLAVGIVVVILALALVIWGISALSDNPEEGELQNDGFGIASFEECVAAGYPVMESYPRQCRTPDGTLFIEDGSVQPGSLESDGGDAQQNTPLQQTPTPNSPYGY